MKRWLHAPWVGASLAGFLAVVLYAQTLAHPFFYDDVFYVLKNPALRGLPSFSRLFLAPFSPVAPGLYRPMLTISYAMDHAFTGFQPITFHLSNVLLHALASGVFFFLAQALLGSFLPALAAALFFAAHPVHTEAVAWVAGRSEILAALFVFLSTIVFLHAEKQSNGTRILLLGSSALLWFLALLSKESALSLPLVLFLVHVLMTPASARRMQRLLWSAVPFTVAFVIYLVLRVTALGGFSVPLALTRTAGLTFGGRMTLMMPVIARYLELMVAPFGLRLEYDWTAFPVWITAGSSIVILAAIGLGVWFWKRGEKVAAFGIAWFFLFLLPVSNIIPIGELIAERFLYLPSAGFCLLVGALWKFSSSDPASLFTRVRGNREAVQSKLSRLVATRSRKTIAAFLLVLVIFSFLTIRRTAQWRDPEILWRSTVERSPHAPHAAENLAALLLAKGNLAEAETILERMVERFSEKPMTNYLMAQLHVKKGERMQAVPFLEQALKFAGPQDIEFTDFQRGAVLLDLGRFGEALGYLERASKVNPYDPALLNNLGIAQAQVGRVEAARQSFGRAVFLFEEQGSLSEEERRNYEGAKENLEMLEKRMQ